MAYFEFPHTRTYDSDLGWLIKRVNSYDDTINALESWLESADRRMDDIEQFIQDIENGNFPDFVQQAFSDWMQRNALRLVGELVKMVFFGLTDTGYFTAYIPESWRDIIFKTTGLDITVDIQPQYGHLVLIY